MTLALEINDTGLTLARGDGILAEEAGFAMLDGGAPETGTPAAQRSRLKPLHAESRFWQDLGTDELERPSAAAGNRAEIAYAQLAALVAPHLAAGRETLFAVPPWYTREQLGLLLGIAKEAGLEPVGLVDAGLAAASLDSVPGSVLQLELYLHRAVVTVLERAGGLRRTRFEILPQHGWLALQQAWLDAIAAAFVLATRFDPLYQAGTEQKLCDGLRGWLDTAVRSPGPVAIGLETASGALAVELSEDRFAAAVSASYDEYARVLQRARPAHGPLHLRVSHRFAGLPGIESRLRELRDSDVCWLPRGAAALGALAWEAELRRAPGSLVLVQHLPVAVSESAAARTVRPASVPAAARPTHVAHGGRIYRLDADPLVLGAGVPPGRRALPLPPGPGVSRSHCSVALVDGGAWLEDHSTYGTWLNGERVGGRVELRAGDRLRIGTPGVECELVRADGDHGAP
jgi:hypothetical protein